MDMFLDTPVTFQLDKSIYPPSNNSSDFGKLFPVVCVSRSFMRSSLPSPEKVDNHDYVF